MERSIIIDVGTMYTRAGIIEDDQLVNILLENNFEKQIQGTIYQGSIANTVKGIKAAFLDIGQSKTAFLHYEDVPEHLKGKLQNNQRIMVQVVKEGVGNKGPKVTGFVNITGKFMVLLPFEKTIGISRKIVDEDERKRLKRLLIKHNPKKYGLIIRTGAREATDSQLALELEELIEKWETVETKSIGAAKATVLYEEPSLAMKVVREYANDQIKEIVINNEGQGQLINDFLLQNLKDLQDKLRVVSPLGNLYGAYNIDKEIEKALKKQVWLKSGANIVIEKTEAMNVIDVNSAKFTKTKEKDKMILKINLQAAKESARQIRLRNLSGIIIIDFIDMTDRNHQDQVVEALQLELCKDKTKTQVYPMTQLGLVQITRQRRYISLQEQMMQHCNCCHSPYRYVAYDYLLVGVEKEVRELVRESIHRDIALIAEPDFIKHIKKSHVIQKMLESKYDIRLQLIVDSEKQKSEYDIKPLKDSIRVDIK